MKPNPWAGLTCAQAGCGEQATHVVVQATDMTLLFRSKAGTACERHALEMENCGGLALSLPGYVEAVKHERPGLAAASKENDR